MFRSFTAMFLLTMMLLTQFSRVFIYAGFELNQQYIASTLCENRDKPEMHCNGKCYLTNKLRQAEEKEKRQEREAQKKNAGDTFFVKSNALLVFPAWFIRKDFSKERPFDLPESTTEILHPPPAVSFISAYLTA